MRCFRVKIAAWSIAALVYFPLNVPFASVPELQEKDELAAAVNWILETGVTTVIRHNIVDALGLGDEDIRVKERGFRPHGARFTEVMAVTVGTSLRKQIVFIAKVDEADGSCVVWQTSANGHLVATVTLEPRVGSLSEGNGNAGFAVTKAKFLLRWREETVRQRSNL